MTALQVACRAGQADIVKRLLKLDAFLNQRNSVGASVRESPSRSRTFGRIPAVFAQISTRIHLSAAA